MAKFKVRTGTLYFRGVRASLKEQWKAYCARRGITMLQRLHELMEKDIEQDSPGNKKKKPKPKPRPKDEEEEE